MRWRILMTALVMSVMLLSSCASPPSYYRITNMETGRSYYVQGYEVNDAGALIFKDARTGKRVTVFNSEVEDLTEDQFENAVYRTNEDAS